MRSLVEDLISLTQVPNSHLKWKHDFSVGDVLDRRRADSLTGAISSLYECYAVEEDAKGWVCKENKLFSHAFQIRNVLEKAKFIYLSRDGRDVACSIKKVPTHDQHVYFIAREWKEEQLECLRTYQELSGGGWGLLVRYEDLIEQPVAELKRVCTFIDFSFEKEMLTFHQDADTRRESEKTAYWKNLSKPVMSNNKGKFLRQLSEHEIAIFEAVSSDILEMLGYPLHASGDAAKISFWKRLWYRIQNKVRSRLRRNTLRKESGRQERAQTLSRAGRKENTKTEPYAPPTVYKASSKTS
jgi:hypothetical protein